MSLSIRTALLSDAPALAGLLRAIGWFEHINNDDPRLAQERIEHHLALCLSDQSHTIYVAQDETGVLLGYAAAHWLPYLFMRGPEGYISELFVQPQGRGQGAGTLLLEAVQAEAVRRGCYRLSLLNNRQRESYERHFYEKHGWEERPGMANFIYWLPGFD